MFTLCSILLPVWKHCFKKSNALIKKILLIRNNYNSNNEDHCPQIITTNITVMKKLEILWELPKCDADTWSEQMLLEKWCQQTCSIRLPLTFNLKKQTNKQKSYYLQNAMKQSAKNQGMPLLATLIFSFVIEKCSHSLPPFLLWNSFQAHPCGYILV